MNTTSDQTGRPGEWPMPRHDVRLSGHAAVAGTIRQPAELWRHHLGLGRVGSVIADDLDGDGELEILRQQTGRLVATTIDGELKWESEASGPVVARAGTSSQVHRILLRLWCSNSEIGPRLVNM